MGADLLLRTFLLRPQLAGRDPAGVADLKTSHQSKKKKSVSATFGHLSLSKNPCANTARTTTQYTAVHQSRIQSARQIAQSTRPKKRWVRGKASIMTSSMSLSPPPHTFSRVRQSKVPKQDAERCDSVTNYPSTNYIATDNEHASTRSLLYCRLDVK